MSTFTIIPIDGREAMQKNFASLPTKVDKFSGRRLSLNERFSIIERGYHLINNQCGESKQEVQLVPLKKPDRAALKKELQEETEQYRKKQEKNKKKSNSIDNDTCDSQPPSP